MASALVLVSAVLLTPADDVAARRTRRRSVTRRPSRAAYPADEVIASDESATPERLRRAVVAFGTTEAPGTIIIDTGNTTLYYVLGQGRAIRYGVGVGREGFTWSGVQTVSRKAEWPDWHPPAEMIARQPYLPRFMAGGPGNPLGARAMYLGTSQYRIHGTNDPSTIGKFVSSGCIRLTNEDVDRSVQPGQCRHQGRGAAEARAGHGARRRYQDQHLGSSGRAHPRPVATTRLGPPGDEPDGVAAQLNRRVVLRERRGLMRSGKLAAWASGRVGRALRALAPAAQAQDFFSQLFGGCARPPRQQPYISMPFSR